MIVQLAAIWVIVLASIIWFVRDEVRLRRMARLEQAARYYAEAPQYRHVRVETEPVLEGRRPDFLRQLSRQGSPAAG